MRFGTFTYIAAAALAAGLISAAPQRAQANPVTLDFTGPESGDYVASYYNGGFSQVCAAAGVDCTNDVGPGPNDGVTFSNTAMAYTAGSNFYNSPSGAAVGSDGSGPFSMTFTPAGYSDLVVYYASESCFADSGFGFGAPCDPATDDASIEIIGPGGIEQTVNLADNFDTTDDLLDVFTEVSIGINAQADEIVFNNVTDSGFGFDTAYFSDVSLVPEPASLSLFLVGIGALGAIRRRRTA